MEVRVLSPALVYISIMVGSSVGHGSLSRARGISVYWFLSFQKIIGLRVVGMALLHQWVPVADYQSAEMKHVGWFATDFLDRVLKLFENKSTAHNA